LDWKEVCQGYKFICVTDPNANRATIRGMELYGARVIVVEDRDPVGGYLGTRFDWVFVGTGTIGTLARISRRSFSTRGVSDPGRGSKWTSCLKGLHYKGDLSVLV
jgi:cysteine synthase